MALTNKLAFVQADIADREKVDSIFDQYRPDTVINFAAESHVDNSISQPDLFIRTNILGTQVLMDACLEYGVQRFHQVSTDEVYGDTSLSSTDKFTEESPLKPSSPYSASKAGADLLALAYYRTYDLPVTISRCSNNYGPYQHKEKLIPKVISLALNDESLPIYGTGNNIRDWIYVDDHCRGLLAILEHGIPGNIYNLSAENELTNNDLVRLILNYLNKPDSNGSLLRICCWFDSGRERHLRLALTNAYIE